MRIAGRATGRTLKTIENVRSVSLVTRWIHEIFQEGRAVPINGGTAVEPFGGHAKAEENTTHVA